MVNLDEVNFPCMLLVDLYGSACWVFSFFHNPPNSDMDYRILNVRTCVRDHYYACVYSTKQTKRRMSTKNLDFGNPFLSCGGEEYGQ